MTASARPSLGRLRSSLLGLVALVALTLVHVAPAGAASWTREAVPTPLASGFGPDSWLTVLPDGSTVYLGSGEKDGTNYTSRIVRRPVGGPLAYASPFPAGFGSSFSSSGLKLFSHDAAGNVLIARSSSPYSVALLPAGGDPAAVTVVPVSNQITELDMAPGGESAGIVSKGSEAGVSFRPAGAASVFDTPRWLDRGGNQRSYGIGVTLDPDGGVFVVYETQQSSALLQAYAPPGGNFGAPQVLDVPQASISLDSFGYAQSSNGHGLLVWDEDTGGNSNSEQIWALTRAPGGLLGGKSLVVQSPSTSELVSSHALGITDDGSQYVGYLRGNPVSGCPTNIDGNTGGAFAHRTAGGPWAQELLPATWPNRGEVSGIATEGNAVALAIRNSTDSGSKCEESDSSGTMSVRIGTGASLGGATQIAAENYTDGGKYGNSVYLNGLDINAGGAVSALVEEPNGTGYYDEFLYTLAGGTVTPKPGGGKLPAPGKVTVGGKLVARAGRIEALTSCMRVPSEGNKAYCLVGADLVAERNKGRLSAVASAKGKKGKKPAPKLQVLARSKKVKIPAGKSRKVVLTLNKAGKSRLAAAGKKGFRAKLRVTIRKGSQKVVVTKTVKVVAGPSKAKPGKRR